MSSTAGKKKKKESVGQRSRRKPRSRTAPSGARSDVLPLPRRIRPTGAVSAPRPSRYPALGSSATLRGAAIPQKLLGDPILAPAAVSYSGQHRFFRTTGDFFRGVSVHIRAPIGYLSNYSGSIPSGLGRPAFEATGSTDGATLAAEAASGIGFNPFRMPFQVPDATDPAKFYMGVMFPACLDLQRVASCFTKWRHKSDIRFEYEPGLNTDNVVQYRMNWSQDVANSTFGLSYNSARTILETDVDDTPNCVAFSGWAPMCLDCPTDSTWRYRSTPGVFVESKSTGGYLPAEIREICSGLFSIIASRADTAATYRTGILFAETVLEFSDPLPATVNIGDTVLLSYLAPYPGQLFQDLPPPLPLEETKSELPPGPIPPGAIGSAVRLRRSDPDDDDLVVSPPVFVPAPSSVPGTPSYGAPPSRVSSRK